MNRKAYMAAINEHTGDAIKTKPSDTYADGYSGIDWSVKLNTEDPLCASCGEIECKCVAK
jgi:hypothetical protein